jgi:hypothetical protein
VVAIHNVDEEYWKNDKNYPSNAHPEWLPIASNAHHLYTIFTEFENYTNISNNLKKFGRPKIMFA